MSSPPPSKGVANWGMPIVLKHSYQKAAISHLSGLWMHWLPIVFIAFCWWRQRDIIKKYSTSVIFTALCPMICSFPYLSFELLVAIIASEDVPSTLGFCTWYRGITSAFIYGSSLCYTAVGLGRYLTIVWNRRMLTVRWLIGCTALMSSPFFADVLYFTFFGIAIPNHVCTMMNFNDYDILTTLHGAYRGTMMVAGSLFNLRTIVFILIHMRKKATTGLRVSPHELSVTLGLLTQSIFPVISTMTGVIHQTTYWLGAGMDPILAQVLDIISQFGDIMNMITSFIFIRAFRTCALDLILLRFLRRKSTEVKLLKHVKSAGSTSNTVT